MGGADYHVLSEEILDGAIVFALNIATVVGMVLHWTKVVLFINTCYSLGLLFRMAV